MKANNYMGARQTRIDSGFSATSTAGEVLRGINLKGKNVVITGGNVGVGLETTKALAEAGAQVTVLVRNVEKAQVNLAGLPNVAIEQLDLADPKSIDACANRFLAHKKPLHVLINNAGIMWVPLRRDHRGFESQLATNYLGHFQLTAKLWSALKEANGARVINVSSFGHHYSPFNFEDPNFEQREYATLLGYGQSKTALNLFSVELNERGKTHLVEAFSVHPGSVGGTELAREASTELFQQMGILDEAGNIRPEVAAGLKTPEQGAATSVWCATSDLLNGLGGVYCEDCNIAEVDAPNSATTHGVSQCSLNEFDAKRLWKLSEQMVGLQFESI